MKSRFMFHFLFLLNNIRIFQLSELPELLKIVTFKYYKRVGKCALLVKQHKVRDINENLRIFTIISFLFLAYRKLLLIAGLVRCYNNKCVKFMVRHQTSQDQLTSPFGIVRH